MKAVLNSFQIAVGDARQSSSRINECAEQRQMVLKMQMLSLTNNRAEEKT